MRLEELAVKYLEFVKGNRAEGTLKNRERYLGYFLKFMGPCMVSAITKERIVAFHTFAKKKHGRGPNAGSEAMASVKSMLRWGSLEMEMADLSFRKFPEVRRVPIKTKRISEADLQRLLQAAPPDVKDFILFGVLTGLRPKEIRDLTQDQIQHAPKGTPYVFIETHKTMKQTRMAIPRSVPLCPLAEEIVERQVRRHPGRKFIFVNDDGGHYSRFTIRNRLRRLCRKLKLPDISPYCFRHTFASMESEQGTETTGLAQLMGHSTTRTLMRYVSNTHDHHLKSVQLVENRVRTLMDAPAENSAKTEKWQQSGSQGNSPQHGQEQDLRNLRCASLLRLVERRGFEPRTPTLRTWCSTN
jgi:integrase